MVRGSPVEVCGGQHSFFVFWCAARIDKPRVTTAGESAKMCQMEVTHDTKLFHLTASHLHIVDVGVSVVGTSVALGGVRVIAVVAVIVCKCQQGRDQ